jgi:branched-chain amino acid transport system substrate-binding protein
MKRFLMVAVSIFVLIGLLVAPACGETPPADEYNLTMAVSPSGSGTTTPTGTTLVAPATVVDITATPTGDYEFVNWTAPAGTFADANAPETTFTMPSQAVTVTANFALPVVYTFTDDQVKIGIAGEVGHPTGDMAFLGASLALAMGAGTITIGEQELTVVISKIDTKEASDETGEQGTTAMTAAIGGVDVVMGGFRTEAVEVYREVVMDAEKLFFNCGAATEELQHAVVEDYGTYKYWFKTTPPNEYHLASSVLRIIDAVAIQLRSDLGLAPDAILDAVIISENLEWAAIQQVPEYVAGLPALNINLLQTYLVSALDSGDTAAALTNIAANYDPHFIIPVYSGAMGAVFAGTLDAYVDGDVLAPMVAGINVYAQLKAPWAAQLGNPPGTDQPYVAYHLHLDTWATGVAQTALSQPFLTAFQAYASGEYPLYTAATFDALMTLKAALEAVGYEVDGAPKAKADDIIAWLEDPANAVMGTTGPGNCVYPQPGTTSGGKPALTEAQVESIYDIDTYGYTYDAADWVMPPHTTHDLAYGPGRATGIGAQWQWSGSVWQKVGVWPTLFGEPKVDQYGDWNFEYTGTVPLVIPANVIAHFTP